jgi:hypothetical protein
VSMLSPLRSSLRLPGIMHLEQRNPSNEHDHILRTLFRSLSIIMAKRSFLFLMGTRVRHEVQKKLMAKAVDVKACVVVSPLPTLIRILCCENCLWHLPGMGKKNRYARLRGCVFDSALD